MRWVGLVSVGCALGLVAVHCAKFEGDDPGVGSDASTDAPLGDALGAADGNVVDAGMEAEADATAPDSGIVTLVEDHFETSCSGWGASGASTSAVAPSKTGQKACQVCVGDAGDVGRLQQTFTLPPPGIGELIFRVSARTSDGSTVGSEMYVNAFDAMGQLVEEQARDVTITPAYVDTEINSVVKTSAKTVQVSLEVPPGTCVLFDDASLTFTPKP